MPNGLNPDQDRNFNLGPNFLQRLSADDKLSLTWKEFNFQRKHIFMHIIKKSSNVNCQQISYQKSKVSFFKQAGHAYKNNVANNGKQSHLIINLYCLVYSKFTCINYPCKIRRTGFIKHG